MPQPKPIPDPVHTWFPHLPQHHFRVIYADPPWLYKMRSARGHDGRPLDYHTLTIPELRRMPVEALAASDCWLFMWVTGPFVAAGSWRGIMRAWGFKPSSVGFVWCKTNPGENGALFLPDGESSFHMGAGYTTRHNAEFCIIGRRGQPQRLDKGVRELIISPRRKHSRKPDEAAERIIRFAPGPYLELFARETRPWFVSWGNDTSHFDAHVHDEQVSATP